MPPVKVLVVDDSVLMRQLITRMLAGYPDIQVPGTAVNGSDALAKAAALKPDVITMDVEMPVMDGLTALRRIMRENPLPVIMFSTLTALGTRATIEALAAGAVDFVTKPASPAQLGPLVEELVGKIRVAAAVPPRRLVRRPLPTPRSAGGTPSPGPAPLANGGAAGTAPGGRGAARPEGIPAGKKPAAGEGTDREIPPAEEGTAAGLTPAGGRAGHPAGTVAPGGVGHATGEGTEPETPSMRRRAAGAARVTSPGEAQGPASPVARTVGRAHPAGAEAPSPSGGRDVPVQLPGRGGHAVSTLVTRPAAGRTRLVVIGCSTGGPAALQQVVPALPRDFPAAVVVVQHIPVGFSKPLAEHLDRKSRLEVRHAQNGDAVTPGRVLVAPAGFELTFRGTAGNPTVALEKGKGPVPPGGFRPSVDGVMTAAARFFGDSVVGVLMTGMGRDGAVGMREIKQAGGRTIAEAESTSVVFGMPRAAIEAGAADRVSRLPQIASEIMAML